MKSYNIDNTIRNQTVDIHLPFKEKLYAFISACFISISLLERIIVYFTNQSYVLFYLAIVLSVFILMTGNKILTIKITHLIMLGLIVLTGIVSVLFNGSSAIRYLEYGMCFFLPSALIFSRRDIHYEQTVKYINLINFAYLVFYVFLYHAYMISSFNYSSLQMEAGYNFVPCILFAVISLSNLKFKPVQTIICLANFSISIIYMFLDNASRGPLVLVVCFFFLIYIRNQSSIKKIMIVIIGFSIAMLLIINYENILIWIDRIMLSYGISVPLLDKLILWSRTNFSVLNGRNALYESAFELIGNSPIIGSGIGCFENYYFGDGLSYVHQYFLQIFCEFGVIGFCGAIIVFFKQLQLILTKKYSSNNIISEIDMGVGIAFFCLSMPKLMFSSSYWLTGSFWMLLAWSLSKLDLKMLGIRH